jgi:hypothetical protein
VQLKFNSHISFIWFDLNAHVYSLITEDTTWSFWSLLMSEVTRTSGRMSSELFVGSVCVDQLNPCWTTIWLNQRHWKYVIIEIYLPLQFHNDFLLFICSLCLYVWFLFVHNLNITNKNWLWFSYIFQFGHILYKIFMKNVQFLRKSTACK